METKSDLEEEKAMVRKMVDSGMSFADVARQIGVKYQWVYKRYDDLYGITAKKKKKVLTKGEKLQIEIDNIKKRRNEIKNEREKISEDLNCPLNRSYEDLVEYRKRRDKEQEDMLRKM